MVEERGSLLTWDFDVLKEEVRFEVVAEDRGKGDGRNCGEAEVVVAGQSVQGSEIVGGRCLLRWSNVSNDKKAVLMYAHHLLPKAHLAGSLSSLQSSHSSFSTLIPSDLAT